MKEELEKTKETWAHDETGQALQFRLLSESVEGLHATEESRLQLPHWRR